MVVIGPNDKQLVDKNDIDTIVKYKNVDAVLNRMRVMLSDGKDVTKGGRCRS